MESASLPAGVVDALRDLGRALETLGLALQRDLQASSQPEVEAASTERRKEADRVARLLGRRLGLENQELLVLSARRFGSGEKFTVAQLAELADVSPNTIRARLMNIGRSLKAVQGRGTLWRAEWDPDEEHMVYVWTEEGRHAVLRELAS